MNKFFLTIATLIFLSISFSSCSKCYTCDFGKGDVREFCPKDFPDKAEGLKMTIQGYEDQGYVCQSK